MSALYRRVRPLTFEELVGQEHVKEPLVRAIRDGRLAQAYLFSGPRGVGKTTTARLLAMAVGCQGAERPCGVCAHCQAVQKGAHPDVVEIDAASNNSVEDVRELRERILLAPLSAPRKVFILDEAHMLSKSAFNALLKTLEEPPPHVLFIFATTEPERMPPTILSRTQHYRFRRLTEEEIALKLGRILKGMGREAEEDALLLVARLSDGALRDAESLLDRLLLLEGPLTRKRVEEALGLPPREALARLARGLARGELKEVLTEARRLYAQGFAPRSLVGGLMEVLREALYAAYGLPGAGMEAPPEALLGALTALDEAMERLAKRSDPLALEAALLQAARVFPAASSLQAGKGEAQPTATPPPGERARAEKALPEEPTPWRGQGASREDLPDFHPTKPLAPPDAREAGLSGEMPGDLAGRWRAFLEALKPTLRAFLREARPFLEEGRLVLRFPESKAFHHKRAEEQRATLLPLVRAHFGVEEVALLLEKKSLDPRPSFPREERRRLEPKASEPPSPAPSEGEVQGGAGLPEGVEEPWEALPGRAEGPPAAGAFLGGADALGQEAPAEEALGHGRSPYLEPPEDPNRRLAEITRLLGARLLWVRRPRLPEAEEPVSEDDIGGTGI